MVRLSRRTPAVQNPELCSTGTGALKLLKARLMFSQYFIVKMAERIAALKAFHDNTVMIPTSSLPLTVL